MAFVFRKERTLGDSKKNQLVGPGTYNIETVQKQSKIPKAYVPFGSMQPKGKDNLLNIHQNATALVGPGSYNIDLQRSGQKIIVSSETQDIKILQISRPNPVFKSGVVRFAETKEEDLTPGPGEYNIKAKDFVLRPKVFSTTSNAKPKILEHLINLNQYQSIPSIPSNIHAFGYNQNQTNELELNEPPVEYFKGEKQDQVGPGQYNPNSNVVKARGISWSQPKAKKNVDSTSNKLQNIPGPGSYEVNSTVNPLYNYKPSVGFASKTLRTMDQRKGAILHEEKATVGNNNKGKELNPSDSRTFSQKAPPSTHIDSDSNDSEYEYIDETTPGPGSYMEISQPKRFKAGKTTTSFGGTKRFQSIQHKIAKHSLPQNAHVGPGTYNIQGTLVQKENNKKGGVLMHPQIKQKERCPSLYNKNNTELPGPGAYEPRNTMEDKLIYKIQRGYRGQFGSTETRSKDNEEEELPGPGSYNPMGAVVEKEVTSSFKSKIERKMVDEKKIVPPIGSYNLIYHDIATKVIKEEEEDPDLIIKKPGFGVGEARFRKQDLQKIDQYDDDDIIKEIQEKHRQERKLKMLKNSSVFKSKDPRFKDNVGGTKPNLPGPGTYYDGEEDYWNKRTYNILFADI